METFKVLFLPHDKTIEVNAGEKLLRAALEAGVHINASCGGEGVCGKCRVKIEKGRVDGGINAHLSQTDVDNGYRLACFSKVISDLTVQVPVESEIDADVLTKMTTPRRTARIEQMDFETLKERGLFVPPVEKRYLELPPATAQDNLSDVTRLVTHLHAHCNERNLEVVLPVIRKIPDVIREQDFRVTATLVRPVRETGKTEIVNIQSGDTSQRNFAVAMDIGTTTLYGQLIDLVTGQVLAEAADFNGQISYGEDVISRIIYAEKPGGLEKLHDVVLATINGIIGQLLDASGIDRDDISTITLAGNTTMTQLLLKVTPKYIRRSPYVPASNLYPPIRATDVGLDMAPHVTALVYPEVSSYVGGDIVAGVMGSGMYRSEQLSLYMDIGTNAEIVIGNKDWLACAACSAGPAFEGGGVKFGMRAMQGAIEDFSLDPATLEPMIMTIGNVRPKGICGSGLIAIVAILLEAGVIDFNGKFNRDIESPRLRQTDGINEYVLAWADNTQIGRDIALTEPDIDNLIRAKGAMYSGCQTLLEEVGLRIQDVEKIYLAGGFGSYVDLERAMTIGLLPETDPGKVSYIGNGSLLGAKMSSLTNRIRKDVVEVMRKMTNFELSETPSYMDHYVAALFLPHTDLNQFPKLKARMESRR